MISLQQKSSEVIVRVKEKKRKTAAVLNHVNTMTGLCNTGSML